jgi:hypothetical protein
MFNLGYTGHGTTKGLIVFFFFVGSWGNFSLVLSLFYFITSLPLFWDRLALCFCMALRTKRTGETVDDMSST